MQVAFDLSVSPLQLRVQRRKLLVLLGQFAILQRKPAFEVEDSLRRADSDAKILLIEGLNQDIVGACLHRLDEVLLFTPRGAEHEIGVVIGWRGTNLPAEI